MLIISIGTWPRKSMCAASRIIVLTYFIPHTYGLFEETLESGVLIGQDETQPSLARCLKSHANCRLQGPPFSNLKALSINGFKK